MSITVTSFYGLGRDFLNMIPTGHNAFTAHRARDDSELDPLKLADEKRKQAQREAWHRAKQRRKELATRINKPMPMACVPGGERIQREEIRREIAMNNAT